MNRIDNQSIQKIQQHLANVQQILIVTHYNPDGDAIGASLGMYHYLKSAGYHGEIKPGRGYHLCIFNT